MNNQQLPLEERVRILTSNRNILGQRDIKSSKEAAIAARNRLPITDTRARRSSDIVKKVSFNDRLAALIDRLYFEEQQQLPDGKFRKKTILQLRQLARDVYIEMKNDGFHDKLNWSDLSDDQRTYYAMRLEQLAKDKGWNIYRCIRLWAAKGLLSDRCRTRKQATKKSRDEIVILIFKNT